MLRAGLGIGAVMVMLLVAVGTAGAHPERSTFFPDGNVGSVPKVRGKADQILTVCKRNSKKLIKRSFKGKQRTKKRNLRLRQLKRCRFRHIQAAVNKARNGAIIRIMPGLYKEEPSRRNPEPDPRCAERLRRDRRRHPRLGRLRQERRAGSRPTSTSASCPNAQNLIAIIGDSPTTPTASATPSATCRSRAWAARRATC